MGNLAFGLSVIDSDSNTIHNSGSITTRGDSAFGIYFGNSSSNTIHNSGGIFATGPGSLAIFDDGGSDNTLNIYPGSQIVGGIDFENAGDVINIFGNGGAGSSSTLMFVGTPTVNTFGDNAVNRGAPTGTYYYADPTRQSINGAALGSLTGGLHDVLLGRTVGGSTQQPQLASTRVEPGMMSSSDDSQIWVSGFGSHRERENDGSVLAYDHDYYGGVADYETSYGRSSRIGFLAGYARTDLATDFKSVNTNSHSGFIGAYGQVQFSSFNLDGSLIAGYEQNDNERLVVDNINGFETAESDYDSFFISPSATLSTQYNISDKLVSRSSITGIYSLGWYDSYTESGTTQSNLSIDDRLAHALVAKVKIQLAYLFSKTCEVGFHIGGRYRYTINNDVDATLSGVSFQYAAAGDNTYAEALFGANARYAILDNLNLTLNTEYSLSDIETNFSGNTGIEITF
ncbi:MAG: autotransporter outer membrane beta-barrel domain-containing protein [Nitrospinales bacterium]